MNRKKLKRSLLFLNIAVWIGAARFLPRSGSSGYMWEAGLERLVKSMFHDFPWLDFFAVCGISLCVTNAIYKFIDAIGDREESTPN